MASGAQQTALMLSDDDAPNVSTARSRRELNPFRKQFGACTVTCKANAELSETRIFWCHICQRKFCWTCFKSHKD